MCVSESVRRNKAKGEETVCFVRVHGSARTGTRRGAQVVLASVKEKEEGKNRVRDGGIMNPKAQREKSFR